MADPTGGNQNKSGSLKKSAPNVSSGWVVMLLSGLVAAVIFLVVTNQGATKYSVLVAAHDIKTGQKVTDADFRVAEVNVDQAQLDRLVAKKDSATYVGNVATGPISSGDLITKSALRASAGDDGIRQMSLPVDKPHAVNGNIRVGDRVDVVNEDNGNFSVTNIEVVSVQASSGGTLGGANTFALTVAVNSDQATRLAQQLKAGKFDVVLSTGATPIDNAANLPGA